MILRSARPSDIQQLLALSRSVVGGMTSLPKDEAVWQSKLDLVQSSFSSAGSGSGEALYFLVLEDTESGRIAGTASIHTGVGLNKPFYNYRLAKHVKNSSELNITVTSTTLNLVNDFTGNTELGSLFLDPDYRGSRYGKFLSQGRFAMMNDFPERFSDQVFAEIRGWLDENGESPFWEHLGRKFFNLNYDQADAISAVRGSQFISDLMPQHPVYLELLPDQAVQSIGKPHDHSEAAMNYLLQEGFRYQGAIDIFDAGPVLECDRSHIRSLKRSVCKRVSGFAEQPVSGHWSNESYIISNRNMDDYRALITQVEFIEEDQVLLPVQCRQALGIATDMHVQLTKLG